MAGRCFGCGDEFGFFKREHDCGNCGRIFCSKCTSNSIVVPSKGKKAVNVCSDCYQALTSLSKKKQLAHDLSQPSKIVHSQNRKSSLPDRQAKSDNVQFDPDEDIRKRLEKLKQPDKSSNHNDVMEKFQNLTGRAPVSAQTTNINTTGPKKTESEQISDLMKQINDECNLDDRSGYEEKSEVTDEDIERRLDILKGRETKNNSGRLNLKCIHQNLLLSSVPSITVPWKRKLSSGIFIKKMWDPVRDIQNHHMTMTAMMKQNSAENIFSRQLQNHSWMTKLEKEDMEMFLIKLIKSYLQRNISQWLIQMNCHGAVFVMKMLHFAVMAVMKTSIANNVTGKATVEKTMKITSHHLTDLQHSQDSFHARYKASQLETQERD